VALAVPPALPWGALPGLVGALGAGRVLRRLEGRPRAPLGFRWDRQALGETALGLALGIAVAGLAIGLIALAGGVRWRAQPGSAGAWGVGAVRALWLLALPAVAEEALLRGYPLQTAAQAAGPGWALALTSVAFAALHLPNPEIGPVPLLNLTLAGVFLGALYLRTASLWWASGAHLGWNWSLAFLGDLPLSGLELVDAPLLEPEIAEPGWVSGAAFGPEGSVLAAAAMAAAAWWTWRTGRLASRDAPAGDVESSGKES
jgi:membrane protease YdiL (CAAX protease family)